MNLTRWIKELVEFIVMLGVMLLVVLALRHFVAEPFIVEGHSMDYTLADKEHLYLWKLAKIERFDVVIIPAPDGSKDDKGNVKRYIKRVIGMPGDSIEYKNGTLYLNGVATEEPYLEQKVTEYGTARPGQPFTKDFTLEAVAGAKTVPEGKVFVMGDNRQNSLDGRSFGFVDLSSVQGEADVVFWPLNQISLLDKYKLNEAGQIVKR